MLGFIGGGGLSSSGPGSNFAQLIRPFNPGMVPYTAGGGATTASMSVYRIAEMGASAGGILSQLEDSKNVRYHPPVTPLRVRDLVSGQIEGGGCTMNPMGACPNSQPEIPTGQYNEASGALDLDRAKEVIRNFMREVSRAAEEISRGQICSAVAGGFCIPATLGVFGLTKDPWATGRTFLMCTGTAHMACSWVMQPRQP